MKTKVHEKNGQLSVKIRFEATNESANHDIVIAENTLHQVRRGSRRRDRGVENEPRRGERTEAWRAMSSSLPTTTTTCQHSDQE